MKSGCKIALGKLLGVAFLVLALAWVSPAARADTILEFDTMVGVSGPFVGAANPIRGINGGGLPWALERASGELRDNGRLRIDVRGLVLADDPLVPEERRLINPAADFRAVVSCLTVDELNPAMVATVNVMTGLFPANELGDARIDADVMLPHPCVAPIIFVTSATGNWFAVTGR